MKKLFAFFTSLILVNPMMVAQAISQRTVYAEDIETATINLKIFAGYGLTINFMPSGETIKQVWLGDPTRYSFTSNGNLCAKSSSECEGSTATVIFLRQIKPIAFPNMTSSSDGSTQITILTELRQYQFKLVAASGQPQYTSLVIKPQSEKPLPVVASNRTIAIPQLISPVRTNNSPTTPPNSNSVTADSTTKKINTTSQPNQPIVTLNRTAKRIGTTLQRDDANALVYGLALARRQGTIKPNSASWRKVQDAIKLLRQGKDRQTAIARSGVAADLFNQLIEAGKF